MVATMVDKMYLKYSLNDETSERLSDILDAVEDKVRALTQRDSFSKLSSSSSSVANGSTTPAESSSGVMALCSRDDAYSKRNDALSTVVHQLTGIVTTIDNEITKLRSKVHRNQDDTATTSTVTAALLQDPIVTATIAVPSFLLSSSTHPTKIMTTKEKSSIRKLIIGNPTLVLVVVADMTITSPPPTLENMLASPRKHRLLIATTNVVALAINPVIVINNSNCDRSSNPSGSNERLKRLHDIKALLVVQTPILADSSKNGKTD